MTRTRLEQELFGDASADPMVEASVSAWLSGSRRFAAFVADNLPKVRKKLRTARDPQSAGEVLFELDVAYRLLRDKAQTLVYEPFASSKRRGPDFAVSHHGKPWFLLEVTRLGQAGADRLGRAEADRLGPRLAQAVAGKLRQLQAGSPNVLLIGVQTAPPPTGEVDRALADLARKAETADDAYFARLGLRDRSAFFQHHERLALVVVGGDAGAGGGDQVAWANPRASQALVGRGRALMLKALGAPARHDDPRRA